MTENHKKHEKSRCFFANMQFHECLCDSNHKKRRQKSSTIPSQRINGLPLLGNPSVFI
jgi:hypothetical protein